MKYQNYEKKMKKLRKVRNGLFHMRFVFLGTALAAIATGSAIMACTGMVNEATQLNSTYQYGETFKPEGNAFLSDVVYEYRAIGSNEWSQTPPTNAGKYEYRYYTKNTFGQNKYSEPVTFNIEKMPIEIKIVADKVTYGRDPDVKLPALFKDDKIESYSFAYDSFEGFKTKVIVDNVVIKSASGEDVTNNYELQNKKKDITFEKRLLDIKFKGSPEAHVFDNTAISNDEAVYDKHDLADGDKVVLGPSKTLTNVGKIPNLRDVNIIKTLDDGSEVDVTHLYTIDKAAEDLVVTKRQIYLASINVERPYNGLVAEQEVQYQPNSNHVAPGHKLEITFTNPDTWRVGESTSRFNAKVVNEDGTPVNDNNYEIHKVYGKVNITKRPIIVSTTWDEELYYDGRSHSNPDFVATGLAQGDTIVPKNSIHEIPTVKNPNYDINDPTHNQNYVPTNSIGYDIYRNGEVVTGYYEAETRYAEMIVRKRPIRIDFNYPETKVYDGKPWKINEDFYDIIGEDEDPLSKGLADGHKEVIEFNYANDIVNVGGHDIKGAEIHIYETGDDGMPIIDSEHEVTQFYDIDARGNNTHIEITPIHISIKTPDIVKDYDGKPAFDPNAEIEYTGENQILGGHEFKCKDANNQVNVTGDKGSLNKLDISIIDKETGLNVSGNYVIDNIEWGNIKVNKLPIIVFPADVNKDYDDKEFHSTSQKLQYVFKDEGYANLDIEVYGHVDSKQIDVTKDDQGAPLTIDGNKPIKIFDKNSGVDISENFFAVIDNNYKDVENEKEAGKLYIQKRDVVIGVQSKEVNYSGDVNTSLDVNDCYMKGEVFGHQLQNVVFDGDVLAPTSSSSVVGIKEFAIVSPQRSNKNVTDNYDVTKETGNIETYFGDEVKIITPNVTKIYDGQPLEFTEKNRDFRVIGLPTIDGQKITCEATFDLENNHSLIDVEDTGYYDEYSKSVSYGKVRNTVQVTFFAPNGEVIPSYKFRNINYELGTVSITQRQVKYRIRGASYVYDGSEKSLELEPEKITPRGYEIIRNTHNRVYLTSSKSLVPGHQLFIDSFGARGTTVGAYDPILFSKFTIYDGENVVKASNYSIDRDTRSTSLNIEARQISIRTKGFTGTYQDFINKGFNNTLEYRMEDLAPGDYIECELKDYMHLVDYNGLYDVNQPLSFHIYHNDGYGEITEVTNNYKVNWDYGTIEISYSY